MGWTNPKILVLTRTFLKQKCGPRGPFLDYMKIRHERPNSDFEYDVRAPLKITDNSGKTFKVQRWNMSRLYADEGEALPEGQVRVSVPFQGFEIDFEASIVEISENEAAFKDLSGRQRELLSVFYQNMLNGKMAEVDEVITSLDTPVDLVPMGETDEEEAVNAPSEQSTRYLRSAVQLFYYCCIAFFLIFVVGGTVYRKFDRINIQHGRFEAPVEIVQAPINGFVEELPLEAGDLVVAGDILAQMRDPDADNELQIIRDDIKAAKRRLARVKEKLDAIEQLRLDARQPLVKELEKAIRKLPKDASPAPELEENALIAKGRLARFDAGISDRSGDFNDRMAQLLELFEEREQTVRSLKRRLGNQKNEMEKLVLRAPSDGFIASVESFEGQFIRAGSDVLIFEDNAPRLAVGYINQIQAQKVHEGMVVNLKFYGGGRTHRTKGTVTSIEAGDNPRRPGEAGFAVKVIPIMSPEMKREFCIPNAPVDIVLDRRIIEGTLERAKSAVLARVGFI